MVKRKQSRVASRCKPIKPAAATNEQDEFEAENLLKRLDDFDMKVQEICKKMELEKNAVIDSVRHLYFIDEQRTSAAVNNMRWLDYLSENSTIGLPGKSTIRESIAEIIEKTKEKRCRKKPLSQRSIDVQEPAPRTTRKKTVNMGANFEEALLTTSKKSNKKGPKFDMLYTPLCQNTASIHASNFLITPKFDPRTPLHPNTLRKPKYGEIAVSLKGSPLQLGLREFQIENLKMEDIDEKTKEELKEFHDKVSKFLGF